VPLENKQLKWSPIGVYIKNRGMGIRASAGQELRKGGCVMEVRRLGVVGAGQMGSGIAEVALGVGIQVVMRDVTQEALEKGKTRIARDLSRRVEKGKITPEERDGILGRLEATCHLEDLKDCDFVIEAATESPQVKARIFGELEGIVGPETVLATNTSSISITRIGSFTNTPHRVIGMHFFNPVPVMKLVEVVRGLNTSEQVFRATWEFTQRLGKAPVEARDMPGFISSRLIFNYMNEGLWALYEGLGSAEQIDTIMRLGANHPMGPLELADFVGLDTVLSVMRVLHEAFGDRYKPCPLLVQLVEAGRLGLKTGLGIYEHGGSP
jgi:3-hydroxybutyryl-CoA dehydrogenase